MHVVMMHFDLSHIVHLVVVVVADAAVNHLMMYACYGCFLVFLFYEQNLIVLQVSLLNDVTHYENLIRRV